jgi:hypothetical protein
VIDIPLNGDPDHRQGHGLPIYGLKEWAAAVQALVQGQVSLVLRKGGLREPSGEFQLPAQRFWLVPTLEHQRPEFLQAAYAHGVQSAPSSGWHPESLVLRAWAEVKEVVPIVHGNRLPKLEPFHCWTTPYLEQRLAWNPEKPLLGLVLRVYEVAPVTIPFRSAYGGCRSWIQLEVPLPDQKRPVLAEAVFQAQRAEILSISDPLG